MILKRRGTTLLEVLLASMIIAIAGAASLPVIASVADGYSAAADTRRAADSVGFAIDRVARVLRETPFDEDAGELGIVSADSESITLSDGRALRFDGETLYLTVSGGTEAVLLSGVEACSFGYLASDGATDASASPETAQRFTVSITVSGLEFRTVVFPRVRESG